MKIAYASDIHREKGSQPHPLALPIAAEVLVLAGDIGMGVDAITWIIDTFGTEIPIVYVPGNHEYYEGILQDVTSAMVEEAKKHPNIHLLINDEVKIGNYWFIGSTCWTDFDIFGTAPIAITQADINDFGGYIRWREPDGSVRQLHPRDTQSMANYAKFYIWEKLREHGPENCIVVTHHAPTEMSIHEMYRGNAQNPCYANGWSRDIAYDCGPKLWFHGHTHSTIDYEIADTRVLCNAIGYPGQFDSKPVLTIDA